MKKEVKKTNRANTNSKDSKVNAKKKIKNAAKAKISESPDNSNESNDCLSDDSITLTNKPEKKPRTNINLDLSPVKPLNHTQVACSPQNEECLKSPKVSLSLSKSRTVNDSKSPETHMMTTDSIVESSDINSNGLTKKRKAALLEDQELNSGAAKDSPKSKKIKIGDDDDDDDDGETTDTSTKMNFRVRKQVETKLEPPKRCKTCFQVLNDAKLMKYPGHPEDSIEEQVAITDPKLCLEADQNGSFDPDEARPSLKITQFCVYDKAEHLCAIDGGLIERNVLLYFSGFLNRIDQEDVSSSDTIRVKDAGPINEWWVTGYDGGEKALIVISSPVADYYLVEPHPSYAPLMESLIEKVYTCKLVVEFLLEEPNPTFEDLLNKIQTTTQPPGVPKLTEDSLFKHAQFISDQVISLGALDSASDSDDTEIGSLITTLCMRTLVRLAAITFVKRGKMKQSSKRVFKVKKLNFVKATTTPLVKDTFDSLFTDQLDGADSTKKTKARYQRCGACHICQLPDCGTCTHCLKVKGSNNRSNTNYCLKRKCPNMAIQEMDDSDPDDEEYYQKTAEEKAKSDVKTLQVRSSFGRKEVKWIGQSVHNDGRKIYYKNAKVGGEEFMAGDCVSVESVSSNAPRLIVGRIMYMWENKIGQKYMHIQWFCRGTESVLGETADPQELYLVDECDNALLSCINSKVQVVYEESPADWAKQGGCPLASSMNVVNPKDDKCFYYRKRYNVAYGRFEDIQPAAPCTVTLAAHRFCVSCDRLFRQVKSDAISVEEKLEDESNSKEVFYGLVRWKGEEYRAGSCVFLAPTVFQFKYPTSVAKAVKNSDKVDNDMYPEYYRKSSEYIKGCNISTPKPLCIGLIKTIKTKVKDKLIVPADVCVRVTKFYRPENTKSTASEIFQSDLNMLYISEEEVTVSFENVVGRCSIVYGGNVKDLKSWFNEGPNRFYFRKCYSSKTNAYLEPSKEHKQLGNLGKKVKGRIVRSDKNCVYGNLEMKSWPKISRPLRCLDVFAGCGGLSEGLHLSGVAETRWAIEHQKDAAEAFRLNNPGCTVFNEDCNALLRRVMNGEKRTTTGQKLPQRGDVELICGGPPCQGFSGMNRFNSRQYYLFKNSLVVTYLSYCDYYRPRFFILENVRNFVSFKRSMVLKLTIRCLQRMGYQVAFSVLQAGQYGVPQTRRRAIIIAAAPGEILPDFPEPTHVFNQRETQLAIVVDDKKFLPNCRWTDSAPYRTITVKDAISDLPKITNGAKAELTPYGKDPISHYQKLMRRNQPMLRDHICKDLVPLVVARISHVPTTSGADWRDLPNIIVKLSDDTYTQKLQYTHRVKNSNKSSPARGVCSCAEGKPCNPSDRQFNTLIPWCLPHTGNRNNNWAGLYGRLYWAGYFSTTTTNPEPMSKQGRVLHPEQNRVVSVRECARSQGFYDSFKFYGSISDKHRQVGNAVPPPLGAAIGREIRKCISKKELSNKIDKDLSVSNHLNDT